MWTLLRIVAGSIGLVALAASAAGPSVGPIARYSTAGKFDNVKEDVQLAIQNRGLVVEQASRINDMLVRTGKDLGTTKQIYLDAEGYSFCSAVTSRAMMEAEPHHIAYCPFVIVVYVLPQEPQRVYVAYRRPEPTGNAKARLALRQVEELLDGIVRDALGLKK